MKIWGWLVWAFTELLPFRTGKGISPAVRWFIWIVADLTFLVLLGFLNWKLEITGAVRPPSFLHLSVLKALWLPIIGQLLIFSGVVLYWFYQLWFTVPDGSPFPDIDEAWQEAMGALQRVGLRLPDWPVFLVLGRAASSEKHLFEASGLNLVVGQTPPGPDAPLHVYADRDGIYVTCPGISVLAKLSDILALEELSEAPGAQDGSHLERTQKPGDKEYAIIERLRTAGVRELTAAEKRANRRDSLGRSAALGSEFMSNPDAVARCKDRLVHLCQLLMRDRHPRCAANGILLLIPIAGTDTLGEAILTAQAAQDDLTVLRRETRVDCPVTTLVVDMEQLPGFAEFIQRQNKDSGNRRGSGFPMATRLPRDSALEKIGQSLDWICTTYLQDSTYRIFQGDGPDTTVSSLFPGNSHLVMLLDEMNERADALVGIIQQAVGPENDALFRYSGCYLAATGPKGKQGFVAGVFQKLVKEQSNVGWTQAGLAEDAQCHAWANYYFVAALVLGVSWVALLVWIIFRRLS